MSKPETTLEKWHHDILNFLDESGGFLTKYVGEKVWPQFPARSRSQAARMHLLALERMGLVSKMDNDKPICWVRTRSGTEAAQHVE